MAWKPEGFPPDNTANKQTKTNKKQKQKTKRGKNTKIIKGLRPTETML